MAHKLLNRDEVLDNELRDRIMTYLTDNPGSYLGKISRELDVSTSTLKYHLNILKSFDLVSTVKKGRCRHYFPKKKRFSDQEKRMYAAIEHDPTRRIVEILHRRPGISQGGLVKETGLSQSTVAWHMSKLEEMRLITSERNEVKEYHLRPEFDDILHEEAPGGQPAMAAEGPAPGPTNPNEGPEPQRA